jgi:hypothetical protein
MTRALRIPVLSFIFLLLVTPLGAQDARQVEPLEDFVRQVARLWAAGEAAALVELVPLDGRVMLDFGEGTGAVQSRHAAAALRALFSERETTAIRATRITIAGGRPLRGFGELSWTSRSRGMSQSQNSVLYIGTVWEDNGWRIRELRLLR